MADNFWNTFFSAMNKGVDTAFQAANRSYMPNPHDTMTAPGQERAQAVWPRDFAGPGENMSLNPWAEPAVQEPAPFQSPLGQRRYVERDGKGMMVGDRFPAHTQKMMEMSQGAPAGMATPQQQDPMANRRAAAGAMGTLHRLGSERGGSWAPRQGPITPRPPSPQTQALMQQLGQMPEYQRPVAAAPQGQQGVANALFRDFEVPDDLRSMRLSFERMGNRGRF